MGQQQAANDRLLQFRAEQTAELETQKVTLEAEAAQLQTDVDTLRVNVGNLVGQNRELNQSNDELLKANAHSASMMAMMKPRNRYRAAFGKDGLSSLKNQNAELQR